MFKTYPILFLWTLLISTKNNKQIPRGLKHATQCGKRIFLDWSCMHHCQFLLRICFTARNFCHTQLTCVCPKKIPKNECFVIFPRYSIATCSLGSSSTNCGISKNKPCCSWCGPFLSLEIYISHPKQSFNLFRNISNAFLRSHEASCHLSLLSLTAHCVDYSDWLFARI